MHDLNRLVESLIAQRKACGGTRDKGECYRPRCKRCARGRAVMLGRPVDAL